MAPVQTGTDWVLSSASKGGQPKSWLDMCCDCTAGWFGGICGKASVVSHCLGSTMGNMLLVDMGKPWLWTLSGWGSTEDAPFPSSSQHSLHWVSGRAKLLVIFHLRPLKILAVPITVTPMFAQPLATALRFTRDCLLSDISPMDSSCSSQGG